MNCVRVVRLVVFAIQNMEQTREEGSSSTAHCVLSELKRTFIGRRIHPTSFISRSLFRSFPGASPNCRRYSRLNCDGLS